MKKEFIPYEQALALKELGFNEPCFASYVKEYKEFTTRSFADFYKEQQIYAPLYQQVFRWFREKYKMKIWFNISQQVPFEDKYLVSIDVYDGFGVGTEFEEEFSTYEEAELECLIKLIELVKKQK